MEIVPIGTSRDLVTFTDPGIDRFESNPGPYSLFQGPKWGKCRNLSLDGAYEADLELFEGQALARSTLKPVQTSRKGPITLVPTFQGPCHVLARRARGARSGAGRVGGSRPCGHLTRRCEETEDIPYKC